MSNRLLRLVSLLALTLVPAVLGACGSSSSSSSSSSSASQTTAVSSSTKPKPGTTINMGIEPWIGYGPWYVAQAQGCFKKQGINVKIINFGNDAQREAAFVGGKTDVSNMPTHTALLFVQKGVDAKAVIAEDVSLTFRELDNRANHAARYLSAQGLKAGDRVALLFDKTIHRYVALLAVLKVGSESE